MSGTRLSVIRMANDIARNFAAQGDAAAIEATAEHITLFWDPRMKATALGALQEPDCGLSAIARAALYHLAENAANG